MSAKSEIERRLRKLDYSRISQELFDKPFNDLSDNEYEDISKIADIYGAKYKKIYSLKEGVDIETVTSNLTNSTYIPDFNSHFNLKIIGIHKTNDSFTIYTEFYTTEEIWIDVTENGQRYKKPQNTDFRRVMTLEKKPGNNYLIISIDPIGEGTKVYKELDKNLEKLKSEINLDFNDFFDIMEIEQAIHKLIKDDKLAPNRVVAKDESTNRVKSVYAQTARDNIKDEDIYGSCEKSDLKLQNLKMKFHKDSVEIFGKTLLHISTKSDNENTDDLTEEIISAL